VALSAGQRLPTAVSLMCREESALSPTGLLENSVARLPETFNHLEQKHVWEGEINKKIISFTPSQHF